jgi:hypothetical protein
VDKFPGIICYYYEISVISFKKWVI